MPYPRRRALLGGAVSIAAVLAPPRTAARAQQSASSGAAEPFPSRPVRLVVTLPPGGGVDLMARAAAARMQILLGQPVLVDNRPAGGGIVGVQHVIQSRPDGHTLLIGASTAVVLLPLVEPNLPYDVDQDLAPVSLLGVTPVVIAVHPSIPARDIRELVALARARPGALNYGAGDSGGTMHLVGESLRRAAGIDIQHVPFRGSGPAVNAAVAGHVEIIISGLPPVLAQAREGRLRMLGVTTPRRTEAAPDLPTLDEQGLPGFDLSNAVGLFAPRATPAPTVMALAQAAAQALRDAEVRDAFLRNGADPVGSTPEEYASLLQAERAHLAELVRVTGVRMTP